MDIDNKVIEDISRITGVVYSEEQLKVLKHRGGMNIIACAGSGKALSDKTGVLTPNGYVPIKELKVGDICYDETGNKQTIEGVFPQGEKEIYKVIFSDGTEIECCKDHLWTYQTNRMRAENNEWKTETLENIISLYDRQEDEIHIPITKPIKFDKKDLLISPYLLGGLLGTVNLTEAVSIISSNIFKNSIQEIGLYGTDDNNKYIPDSYKYSDIRDRKLILEGLIDTTGVTKTTCYEIKVVSEKLADDIKFIAETLGRVVTKTKEEETYKLIISKECNSRRTIVDIIKTGKKSNMTCIKVSSTNGLFVTENCVVTHNTTILTHLLAKRIKSGEIADTAKLLCTTYSKSGAAEMEERIDKLFKKLGIRSSVNVKTLHAFYLMVLKRFGFSTSVIDNKTRLRFIMEATRDARVKIGDEDLQTIDSLLSYQVSNLLGDDALVRSYVYNLDNVSLQQYTAIRMGYNARKQKEGLIDFDDMQLYMYSLLVKQQRADILTYCRKMYTDFYIDEAQDISKIQFEILRTLITDPKKLVLIGDDDQCIYQWRGADPSIILNIFGYYDIERFILSTNYRCKGNIVRMAAKGIKHNIRRADKTMQPFKEGGEVKIVDTQGGSLYNQAKYAYMHIKDLVINKGVTPSDIAILSRNNQHLALLNNMLFKQGIYCDSSMDMRLTNTKMYKDIRSLIDMSEDTCKPNITASNIWRVCIYMGLSGAKFIANVQQSTGMKLSDTLGYILNKHTNKNVDWKGKIVLPPTIDARIGAFCDGLRGDTINNLEVIYKLLVEADEIVRIKGLMVLYLQSTEFMYKSTDRSRSIKGVIEYTNDLLDKMGVKKLKAFFRASEQFETGKMAVPGSKILMSTIHGAKGSEREYVVVFADDNVTFPSFEGIAEMDKNGVSRNDIYSSLDEDRRLHYVSVTRAKSNLTLFTDSNNISVYTLEALGAFDVEGNNNENIVRMAIAGELDKDIIEKAKEIIFNDKSEYRYDIDISSLQNESILDIIEKEETVDESKLGMSLDNIGSMGSVMVLGND